MGYASIKSDIGLIFFKCTSTEIIFVVAYVDDILFTSSNSFSLQTFVTSLYDKFSLKDIGSLEFFLGI